MYISMVSKEGSSVKVAVYIFQGSVRKGSSVKVAACISQWSVRKEAVLKLRCIYLKSQ